MDPFSAASGAAGIISLGIVVCGALVSYYGDVKDCPEDIIRIYKSVKALNSTLQQLQQSLKDETLDQKRREQAENYIAYCVDGLRTLSKKLGKFDDVHNTSKSMRQQAGSSFQRGLYPFRRSTIEKLYEIVKDTQSGLDLALKALQIDITIKLQQTSIQIDTKVSAIASSVTDISRKLEEISRASRLKRIKEWLSPPDAVSWYTFPYYGTVI